MNAESGACADKKRIATRAKALNLDAIHDTVHAVSYTQLLRNTVKEVLDKVKTEGDKAVREYEERFDKVKLDSLGVTETEIAEAEKEVPIELKAAIMLAQKNMFGRHFLYFRQQCFQFPLHRVCLLYTSRCV